MYPNAKRDFDARYLSHVKLFSALVFPAFLLWSSSHSDRVSASHFPPALPLTFHSSIFLIDDFSPCFFVRSSSRSSSVFPSHPAGHCLLSKVLPYRFVKLSSLSLTLMKFFSYALKFLQMVDLSRLFKICLLPVAFGKLGELVSFHLSPSLACTTVL